MYDEELSPPSMRQNNNLKIPSSSYRQLGAVPQSTLNEYYEMLRSVDSQGVFNEYSERQLRSLLWELASHYDGDMQKQKDIKSAFDASLRLQRHIDGLTKRIEKMNKAEAYIILPEDFLKDMDKLNNEVLTNLTRIT